MIENVTLDILLIPRFRYVGASGATTATELTALLLSVAASARLAYAPSKKDVWSLIKELD
ncbi:MAG: hypothetical protein ACXV7G_13545 [Halobacteriota archaeon]